MDLGFAMATENVAVGSADTAHSTRPVTTESGAAALDRMIELLALSPVRISLVALEFLETGPRVAANAAMAACGATGFLIALSPQRFVIVDVGPRGASPRADQAIAERIRALAMAALSGRRDARPVRLRSADLHVWSDQAVSARQCFSQLMRVLGSDAEQTMHAAAGSHARRERAVRVA